MDDEDSKNDSLKHNSPAGANVEEAAVAELDGERCDAASDHTHTMQNTGENGTSGAAGSEKGTDTDTWETINSLVKQVCCPVASIDQERVGGGSIWRKFTVRRLLGSVLILELISAVGGVSRKPPSVFTTSDHAGSLFTFA